MATRSSIGIELENGNVLSIYCHWDGYPSGNGKILHDHYTDRNKVIELINLGNISYLEREVNPPEGSEHSFNYPFPNVTVSYHRDRDEEYKGPEKFETSEIFSENFGQSWAYLFNNSNQWMVTRGSGKYVSVISLLETDTD
jgi:hypothetical protein